MAGHYAAGSGPVPELRSNLHVPLPSVPAAELREVAGGLQGLVIPSLWCAGLAAVVCLVEVTAE